MFKVVTIVDKKGTAIDRLAQGMAPYMDNINYVICDVHPKRPDIEQLERFEREAKSADLIDAQYFRSSEMLRQRYEWLKNIPTILTHHNPYSINESDWNDYQLVIGINKTITSNLKRITSSRVEYVSHAADPYFWEFNKDYQFERSVIMVANRIESKKGILPVALACKNINARLYLVGNISDANYFHDVVRTGAVKFFENITNEQLRDLYYRAGIHVCNSVDNFESGTLPVIEAAFCGVPILSRSVGHIPDWAKPEAIVINNNQPDDIKQLEELLSEMFEQPKKLESLRNEAWFHLKHMNHARRAYAYQRMYRSLNPQPTVSIIMPVAAREDITRKSLEAIAKQTYTNLELIIIDDGDIPQYKLIDDFKSTVGFPVKYIYTKGVGYNLAKARNLGIIESTSEILVFCDQRIVMNDNAVDIFIKHLKPRTWLYGSKGVKKDFVENFSCIYREDIVTLGMFNERITEYGGMSQEIRARARRNAYNLEYLEAAKAEAYGKSSNRFRKKFEIMRMKDLLWKVGLN